MPLQTDLENSVQNIFNNYSQSTVAIPSNKGNLYELYLYILIYKTLKRISGNQISIVNPTASNNFIFRCSPGLIKNSLYSYITFSKGNLNFELRNGIEIIGINMYHEMDITIFQNVQQNNSRPNKSKHELKLAIECKNHANISSLKGECRKFLGAITDLSFSNHGMSGCIHCGIGFKPFFAIPQNSATNNQYRIYLNNYGLNPLFNLRPNTIEERNFIQEIENLYLHKL